MAEKRHQDAEKKHRGKRTKAKTPYDETKVADSGEGPLYPPKGGSYIHK